MRTILHRAPLLPALFLALCLAAGVGGQPFEERTDVVEVEVPVNVVTRDGTPVRGLDAGDFELLDDGEPQEITGFEVVDLEDFEVESYRARRAREELPAAARRHFLLLFDLSFSDPGAILEARRAAREWVLTSLHPTDLAAVMIYSLEIGPRLIVTFTPDRAQLVRAIDTLGAPELLDPRRRDPLRFVIDAPDAQPGVTGLLDGVGTAGSGQVQQALIDSLRLVGLELERSRKAFERSRINAWSRSLGEVARQLDSIRGRKHVVFFSEGFEGSLLLGRLPDPDDPVARQEQIDSEFGRLWAVDTDNIYGDATLQGQIEAMLEEFRRADCVIQAVDVGGLSAATGTESRRRQVGQDALFYIARGTGGELYEEANRFGEQLDRVLERSAVTYLLSFQPPDLELDGRYHRLKVKLREKERGVEISHRAGYYAPRPFEELHPFEKSLLAAGAIAAAEPRREVSLDVLAAPFQTGSGDSYLPVIVEVDGSTLLDGHDGEEAEVEIYAYASDERGRMRDFFTRNVRLDLGQTRPALLAGGLKYYGHLDLGPGRHLVRVLVRAAGTGRTGVETAAVEVPSWGAGGPVLLPPFFLEVPGRWLLVREPAGGGSSVVYPFTLEGEPYVPAARPRLTRSRRARLCLVAYHLGDGEPTVNARVLGPGGTPVDGGRLEGVERTVTGIPGLNKIAATFEPRKLAPGDYDLQVTVTDPATGEELTSTAPFEVAAAE